MTFGKIDVLRGRKALDTAVMGRSAVRHHLHTADPSDHFEGGTRVGVGQRAGREAAT